MTIEEYKQALADYKPVSRSEKDYLKRAIAKDDWNSILRNSRYSPEHMATFITWKQTREDAQLRALDKADDAWKEDNYNKREGML